MAAIRRAQWVVIAALAGCSVIYNPDRIEQPPADADSPGDDSFAMLSLMPSSPAISWGDVVLGQTSAKTSLTVLNSGDGESGPLSLAFDDETAGFAIVDDTCSGRPLAPTATCTFAVTFKPAAGGAAITTMHVMASPGGDVTRALDGNGVIPGVVDIVETSADFLIQRVDAGAATNVFVIRNISQQPIGTPAPTIGGDITSYSISANTCTTPLATGSTCAITVAFQPRSVGQKAGSLTVTSEPGGQDVATLAGTGAANVAVTVAGTGSGLATSSLAGISCKPSCTADFASSPVTLSAQPDLGSTFTGWSGDCAGAGSCTLDLTGSKTATAMFAATTYALSVAHAGSGAGTVTSSDGNINCGTACSHAYGYNTMVTLTATAASGSTFTGWSGACSGTGTCTVTMNQARAVTATFTRDSFTVTVTLAQTATSQGTVTSSPAGLTCSGTTCTGTFASGTQVTLDAVPDANRGRFLAWSSGPCASSTATACTFTMPAANTTATAMFDWFAKMTILMNSYTPSGSRLTTQASSNTSTTTTQRITCTNTTTLTGTCVAGFARSEIITITYAGAGSPWSCGLLGLGTVYVNGSGNCSPGPNSGGQSTCTYTFTTRGTFTSRADVGC